MSETALTTTQGGAVAAPATDSVLAVIAAAARDPQVDVAKMAQLLEMHERIVAKRAEIAFTEAMNRVQSRVPRLVKDRKIMVKGSLRSKYAALEDIDRALRPLIIEEGFSLSYDSDEVPPKATRLILTVKHRMGHAEKFSIVLPLDKSEFRSEAQNASSTISFGRRILLGMAFNVITVDEDKDGNAPSQFITDDQVFTISTLLKDCGIAETDQRFLAWVGADKIEHIDKSGYERVIAELNKRSRGRK